MCEIKKRSKGQKTGQKYFALFLGVSLLFLGKLALADDHHDDHGSGYAAHARANSHHYNHYYRNGRWYRHGWFGFGVAVPTLSAGVYVNTLPPAYTPIVVHGATYYYADNTYFSTSPDGGYVVVAQPS